MEHNRPIIFVTDVAPEPARKGSQARNRDLLMHLHDSGYQVHVLFQQDRVHSRAAAFFLKYTSRFTVTPSAPLAKRIHDYLVWRLSHSGVGNGLLNLIRYSVGRKAIPFHKPYTGANEDIACSPTHCSPETRAALQRMVTELQPRAIIVSYAYMAECMTDLSTSALLLLDTLDVAHLRTRRLLEQGLDTGWMVSYEEECRLLHYFDVIIAIQESEAEVFREMAPELQVITAGVSYPIRQASPNPKKDRILIVGSRASSNVHGLQRFLEEAWPKVRQACPDAELDICGTVSAGIKKRYAGVKRRGVVADLTPYYDNAEVLINPVWIGSGLKTKTVEALSFGKALITTPCGIEGMTPSPAKACRIAEDAEGLAEHIIELLQSPAARESLEAAAYDYAARWLSPAAVYKQLDIVLAQEKHA